MIIVLQLIALGVFALVGVSLWKALRPPQGRRIGEPDNGEAGPIIDGQAQNLLTPIEEAAQSLRHYDNARARLNAQYPALFAMLGGYLNAHTLSDHGGVQGAVKEMLADWRPRKEEIAKELAQLLAEAEQEEQARAVVLAACDADFENEGYKSWLSWLLSQFNSPNS